MVEGRSFRRVDFRLLLADLPVQRLAASIVTYGAALNACERAEQWTQVKGCAGKGVVMCLVEDSAFPAPVAPPPPVHCENIVNVIVSILVMMMGHVMHPCSTSSCYLLRLGIVAHRRSDCEGDRGQASSTKPVVLSRH